MDYKKKKQHSMESDHLNLDIILKHVFVLTFYLKIYVPQSIVRAGMGFSL